MKAIKMIPIVVLLASLLLAMTTTGCLSLRHHSPLESSWLPQSSVALLPVIADDIGKRGMTPREFVQTTDKVLDCLASGKTNKLMGPTEVTNRLGNVSRLERFGRDINHQLISVDEGTSKMLVNCGHSLGINQIILTQVSLRENKPETLNFGGILVSWSGSVHVDMELVELSPPFVIRKVNGGGFYNGGAGIVLFLIPVYGQKTAGRAVDDVCRDALHRLFKNENQSIFSPSLGSTNAPIYQFKLASRIPFQINHCLKLKN